MASVEKRGTFQALKRKKMILYKVSWIVNAPSCTIIKSEWLSDRRRARRLERQKKGKCEKFTLKVFVQESVLLP